MKNEAQLYAMLIALGITEVAVYFEGYGDSGSIDSINTAPTVDLEAHSILIAVRDGGKHFVNGEWVSPPLEEKEVKLETAITTIVYDWLESTGIDWYNNGGGFGTWIWKAPDTITFEVNVRETNYTCKHLETTSLLVDRK